MTDQELIKLKEKIEDFICLNIADDIDDYENIVIRLTDLLIKDYKQLDIEELREQKRFFSYDPVDCEFDLHGTLEEAKEKAEYILDFYKGEAHDSGWEDGVSEICYGEIKGESVVTLHEHKDDFTEEEWNEKYNSPDWDECINYEIKPLEPKHETVEQGTLLLHKLLDLIIVSGDCPHQLDLKDHKTIDGQCMEISDLACKKCWLLALNQR